MKNRNNRNFTLLELLLLITIITILAGLLLSGIYHAKKSAKRIACNSNLRNISLAQEMYVNAFGGNYPYPIVTMNGTNSHVNGYKMMSWPKYFFQSISNTELYFCPEDEQKNGRPEKPDDIPNYSVSYQYRFCLGYVAENIMNTSLKSSMFRYPSQQVLFHERTAWHAKCYVLNQNNTPHDSSEPYIRLNSLYIDGHVQQWLMGHYDSENKCYDANWFNEGKSPSNPRLGYDTNP